MLECLIVPWLMNYSLPLQFEWAYWYIRGRATSGCNNEKNIGSHFYKSCLQNTYKSDTQSPA